MQLLEQISLKNHNTFGIDVYSRFFATLHKVSDYKPLTQNLPLLILGGGSNVLFTKNWDGVVLKNKILGIEKQRENDDFVWIKAGAGEVWHDFVLHCVKNEWAGIENLSLIPGTVGASPLQNIGAYGVEIKDVFERLDAIHVQTGDTRTFSKEECEFGYRNSVFKQHLKGQYIITHVTFKLSKHPDFNISYGAIQATLEKNRISSLSIKAISDAVIEIRQSKLPDPSKIGNAGSFFKNPIVSQQTFESLKAQYPKIPAYPAQEKCFKLAAGWLIESCGWKGKVVGNTGTYKHQSLVLVNHGKATGDEVYQFSKKIQQSVKDTFGIQLEAEVTVF